MQYMSEESSAMEQQDYDSPWKDVLDLFFEACMEFFFPQAHAQIDWSRGFEFLDKELQKITADAAIGRRFVDKLVKVWLKSGEELWVLIHIEVQGGRETGFESRLFVYHYRIHDRFSAPVATFVILTDEEETWRPTEHHAELLGTEVRFRFPAVKMIDYWNRWDELEQSENPFAVVAQAQLIAQQTRGDAPARLLQKLELVKRLYARGFNRQQIIGLFYFLDWVLTLPKEMAKNFEQSLTEYEEEKKMKFVTSVEEIRIEKGILRATAALTLRLLQKRFGILDEAKQSHILALPLEQLEGLSDALLDFTTPADLEAWLRQHPRPSTSPADSKTIGDVALQP